MNRTAVRALAGLGALAVLVALAVALVGADLPTEDVDRAVRLAGVLAFLAGLYHLWRLATDTGGYTLAPWSVGGSIVPGRPEETPSAHPLSGERLAGTLEEAERAARRDRRVEDGLDVVRPALRESLLAALVRGGRDREAAEEALAAGTWTDDPVAAATLDRRAGSPERSVRRRVRSWLFPAREVRTRVRRAVGAIAEAAGGALPAVVGQRAPRTNPVVQPRLERLRRGVDGRLDPAANPDSLSLGPDPGDLGAPADPGDGDDGSAADGPPDPASTLAGDGQREGFGSDGDGGDGTAPGVSAESALDALEGEDADGPSAGRSVETGDSQRTARWQGGVAATVALATAGLVTRQPALVLAAVVPLGYVAYGSAGTAAMPDGLVAVRQVAPTPAPPGRSVRVRLTVANRGDGTVSDLRVVDGVPDRLAVVSGTPRAGTALAPGEEHTVAYVVVARRGEHDFDRPTVRVRDASAASMATGALAAGGDDRLVCRLDADVPPLEEYGTRYAGQLSSDEPGQGVEFHSVRKHRPEDPADRIDWRHYAKRGELATVDYRHTTSATVVLVLDARPVTRVVSGPGRPTAVELCGYAATRALAALLGSGHDVAAAVVGLDGPGPAGIHWLAPGGGREQQAAARELVERGVEGGSVARSARTQVRKLVELAPPGAQFAWVSPLLDREAADAVEAWHAHGVPVTVLSPDVLPGNTVSGQLEAVRRRTALARCQAAGAHAIDWRRGTPLPLALEYAFAAGERLGGRGGQPGHGRGGGHREVNH